MREFSPIVEHTIDAIIDRGVQGEVPLAPTLFSEQFIIDLLEGSTSRTPVREAITVLAATGFIEKRPKVGHLLLPTSDVDMESSSALARGAEIYAVGRLVGANQLDVTTIEADYASLAASKDSEDLDDFMRAETVLHQHIVAQDDIPLSETVVRAWGHKRRLFKVNHPFRQPQSAIGEILDATGELVACLTANPSVEEAQGAVTQAHERLLATELEVWWPR